MNSDAWILGFVCVGVLAATIGVVAVPLVTPNEITVTDTVPRTQYEGDVILYDSLDERMKQSVDEAVMTGSAETPAYKDMSPTYVVLKENTVYEFRVGYLPESSISPQILYVPTITAIIGLAALMRKISGSAVEAETHQ